MQLAHRVITKKDVAMVTSMLFDGQIAWRHHGLMRIKSAEIAGLHPSSITRGSFAVKNSMPDLNLDPGHDPVYTLSRGLDLNSVLATERQRWHYGVTSQTERSHKRCKHSASLGAASLRRHITAVTLVEDPIVWRHQPQTLDLTHSVRRA